MDNELFDYFNDDKYNPEDDIFNYSDDDPFAKRAKKQEEKLSEELKNADVVEKVTVRKPKNIGDSKSAPIKQEDDNIYESDDDSFDDDNYDIEGANVTENRYKKDDSSVLFKILTISLGIAVFIMAFFGCLTLILPNVRAELFATFFN